VTLHDRRTRFYKGARVGILPRLPTRAVTPLTSRVVGEVSPADVIGIPVQSPRRVASPVSRHAGAVVVDAAAPRHLSDESGDL